jgi:hypothetical protein
VHPGGAGSNEWINQVMLYAFLALLVVVAIWLVAGL